MRELKQWNSIHVEKILDQSQTTTTGSRRTSTKLTVEVSTEKGEMIITTEDHLLRTATEVLERELTEISVPNTKKMPNLPNGMHNFQAYGIDGRAVLETLKETDSTHNT